MERIYLKNRYTGLYGYYYPAQTTIYGMGGLPIGGEWNRANFDIVDITLETWKIIEQMKSEIIELRKRLDNKHFENKF